MAVAHREAFRCCRPRGLAQTLDRAETNVSVAQPQSRFARDLERYPTPSSICSPRNDPASSSGGSLQNTSSRILALPGWAAFYTQICKRSKDSMIGRNFATNAARISGVKPSSGSALARRRRSLSIFHRPVCIAPIGAKEGVDILPLCSRGIIVKVFANVFFKNR